MEPAIIFKTKIRNHYLHSTRMNRFLLCHPILYYLVDLVRKGVDVREWLDGLDTDTVDLGDCGIFKREELAYYYRKYLFLREHRYFEKVDIGRKVGDRLKAESVQVKLANTSQLTFEVTDACNLNCRYCAYGEFYSDYDRRESKNLSIHKAKRFLNYLLDLWNSPLNTSHHQATFVTFYGGEPLLNFSFIREMVEYVKHLDLRHNRIEFSMTTNGLLLEKYMDFLVQNDFQILISLDGNERHNGYRVFKNDKPAYRQIMLNIMVLRQKYPDFFVEKVRFNAVLHKKNRITEVYQFFQETFNKFPSISEVNPYGIVPEKKEQFRQTYRNLYEDLNQAEDYFKEEKQKRMALPKPRRVVNIIRRYSGVVFRKYDELIFSSEIRQFVPTGTCVPFSRMVFLTVNGKILPCERIGHQFALGRVDDDRVELDFEQVARKYNQYYDSLSKQCTVCYNTEACVQCIFNLNILDAHPQCNGFKNYQDIRRHFSFAMSYMEENPETYFKVLKEMTFG